MGRATISLETRNDLTQAVQDHSCEQAAGLARPFEEAITSINAGEVDLGINTTVDIKFAAESLTEFVKACKADCGTDECPLKDHTAGKILHEGLPMMEQSGAV